MCCMSETRLGQFTYEMGRFNTGAPLRTDCYQTPTIKFIVPCLQKQGHLIFKGLHQVAQYHAAQPRAAGFQLEGFAWREAVITRAMPEVSLLVLPSDGWRVLPADLQVYPPIWRAGGRLANTLPWIFKDKFWKCCISGMGGSDWHGMKGMWVDRMLDPRHHETNRSLDICWWKMSRTGKTPVYNHV